MKFKGTKGEWGIMMDDDEIKVIQSSSLENGSGWRSYVAICEEVQCIEDAKPIKFMVQDAFWQLEEYKRQIERAAIVFENEIRKPTDSKNHRTYYRDVNPLGNKIHAVQRMKLSSKPLI